MPQIPPALSTLRAFERGLPELAPENDPAFNLLHGLRDGHRVYTLGLQDILPGPGLGEPVEAGWQFADANDELGASATVAWVPVGQIPTLLAVARGPEVATAVQAIREAEAMPLFHQPGCEVCILKIPGMGLEAVWLKTAQGNDDRIAPYLTLSPGIERMRWYSLGGLAQALSPLVTEFLAFASATLSDVQVNPVWGGSPRPRP